MKITFEKLNAVPSKNINGVAAQSAPISFGAASDELNKSQPPATFWQAKKDLQKSYQSIISSMHEKYKTSRTELEPRNVFFRTQFKTTLAKFNAFSESMDALIENGKKSSGTPTSTDYLANMLDQAHRNICSRPAGAEVSQVRVVAVSKNKELAEQFCDFLKFYTKVKDLKLTPEDMMVRWSEIKRLPSNNTSNFVTLACLNQNEATPLANIVDHVYHLDNNGIDESAFKRLATLRASVQPAVDEVEQYIQKREPEQRALGKAFERLQKEFNQKTQALKEKFPNWRNEPHVITPVPVKKTETVTPVDLAKEAEKNAANEINAINELAESAKKAAAAGDSDAVAKAAEQAAKAAANAAEEAAALVEKTKVIKSAASAVVDNFGQNSDRLVAAVESVEKTELMRSVATTAVAAANEAAKKADAAGAIFKEGSNAVEALSSASTKEAKSTKKADRKIAMVTKKTVAKLKAPAEKTAEEAAAKAETAKATVVALVKKLLGEEEAKVIAKKEAAWIVNEFKGTEANKIADKAVVVLVNEFEKEHAAEIAGKSAEVVNKLRKEYAEKMAKKAAETALDVIVNEFKEVEAKGIARVATDEVCTAMRTAKAAGTEFGKVEIEAIAEAAGKAAVKNASEAAERAKKLAEATKQAADVAAQAAKEISSWQRFMKSRIWNSITKKKIAVASLMVAGLIGGYLSYRYRKSDKDAPQSTAS